MQNYEKDHLHLKPTPARRHYAALLLLLPAIVFASLLAFFVLAKQKEAPKTFEEDFVPQVREGTQSRWATHSAVVSLEASLKELNDQANKDEPETRLAPPLLDFETSSWE